MFFAAGNRVIIGDIFSAAPWLIITLHLQNSSQAASFCGTIYFSVSHRFLSYARHFLSLRFSFSSFFYGSQPCGSCVNCVAPFVILVPSKIYCTGLMFTGVQ